MFLPRRPKADPPPQPVPEEDLELEGLPAGEDGILDACAVPGELEAGRRTLRLPEGVTGLSPGAFSGYNGGDIIRALWDSLCSNRRAIEIEKQIQQKRISPREYPRELATLREWRDYVLRREQRERLLRLLLPDSLTAVPPGAFPVLLEAIQVSPDHPAFRSEDGVLFSKDGKTLIRYPGLTGSRVYAIPPSVERIAPGAFRDAFLDELTIPGARPVLTAGEFAGLRAGHIRVGEGVEVLSTGLFRESHIGRLSLPRSLTRIEDEAFRGLEGLSALDYDGPGLDLGAALFRDSRLDGVSWWCWQSIPKGAFLNARLRRITIPDGVKEIGPYAFAGCYTAKSVKISPSVEHIGPSAFDLGPTYNRPVTLPEHLYGAVCRLPARSPVNKRGKAALLRRFEAEGCTEDRQVLERQLQSLESMPPLQKKLYPSLKSELAFYRRQLARCPEEA